MRKPRETKRSSLQGYSVISTVFILGITAALLVFMTAGCGYNGTGESVPDTAAENGEDSYSRPVVDDPWEPEAETGGANDEIENKDEKEDQPGETAKDNSGSDEIRDLKVISDGDYLLALVTKETTLKPDYAPSDLRPVPSYMYPSRELYLRREALEHLEQLWHAAGADGVVLHIRSAYRSYSYQESLFRHYAEKHGAEQANRFSARSGQSEHQLGTAVDFGGTDVDFSAEFANTEQGRWLAENAHRFGFVLSYPEGKEHITGYIFEPWHYRYIGVEAAAGWKASGKTLQEFLETKPQFFE